MIETQIHRRGVHDAAVLAAMSAVPRHEFVPAEFRKRAYEDAPLPIGEGQTISQPYMVAAMTAALHLNGNGARARDRRRLRLPGRRTRVARQRNRHHRIPRRSWLPPPRSVSRVWDTTTSTSTVATARWACRSLRHSTRFLVAAGAPAPPVPLVAQLAEGGRMVVPVGSVENQELQLIERSRDTFRTTVLEPCRFVPLIGAHGWKESSFR